MRSKIIYEPFKTLEEQDQAEKRIKLEIELKEALECEQQELLLAEIEGTVQYIPLISSND